MVSIDLSRATIWLSVDEMSGGTSLGSHNAVKDLRLRRTVTPLLLTKYERGVPGTGLITLAGRSRSVIQTFSPTDKAASSLARCLRSNWSLVRARDSVSFNRICVASGNWGCKTFGKVGTVDRNFLPINSSAGYAPFSNSEVLYASKTI